MNNRNKIKLIYFKTSLAEPLVIVDFKLSAIIVYMEILLAHAIEAGQNF